MIKAIKTIQDVLNKVQEIQKKNRKAEFIFRGENKEYEKVSSTLYREYDKNMRHVFIEETGKKEHELTAKELDEIREKSRQTLGYMNFSKIQLHITESAKKHYAEGTSDFHIATELQHYGGKTNLIDFTKNILIALFFACDGRYDEDGRLCILKYQKEKLVKDITCQNTRQNLILESNSKNNRIIFQSSIFIMPTNGYLEIDKEIPIPKNAKESILEELNTLYNINTNAIYNDIYGFMLNEDNYKTAFMYFHIGIAKYNFGMGKKDTDKKEANQYFNEAIAAYGKAIKLIPNYDMAYNNRAIAKNELGKHREAMRDYNKAIRLDPNYANAYYNRGNARYKLAEYEKAKIDFKKVLAIDPKNEDAKNMLKTVEKILGNLTTKK